VLKAWAAALPLYAFALMTGLDFRQKGVRAHGVRHGLTEKNILSALSASSAVN
jgi:hypothetical protein